VLVVLTVNYTESTFEIVGASVDPALNMQLATALKKAKELGVPKENIEKALAGVCSTEF
jgi:transcriptional/translational regulatory protein YebC/TACO1